MRLKKQPLIKARHPFTLIEILLVIVIITILAGMLLPSMVSSRKKAMYIRWKAWSAGMNRDPETILNFNFEDKDFKSSGNNALKNGAASCSVEYFDLSRSNGTLKGGCEWTTGRWKRKNAIQFGSASAYIEVPGKVVLNFRPDKEDFTIMTWVNFDALEGCQTLFSKSAWVSSAQYDLYYLNNKLCADMGSTVGNYTPDSLSAGKWYHFALKNSSQKFELYINGELVSNTGSSNSGSELSENAKFLIGVAGKSGGTPQGGTYFGGRMDELMAIKRDLSPAEIRGAYLMGKP